MHHADRADHLVAALAEVLADPPQDVFAPEVVAVHSRGIERWVSQQLSHRLGADDRGAGIAANLDFPFPGRLIADAVSRASDDDPTTDPWRPDRLTWPLLEVVDQAGRDGEVATLGPLGRHLTGPDGSPSPRRLGAVRRVADLFDRYATHRPALLTAWAAGDDVDADGRRLDDRFAWQPALWRRVRAHVDRPSGPERLETAVAALRAGRTADGRDLDLGLPDRLAVFGVTALPVTYVQVLAALAAGPTPTAPDGRDVHLFLLHPSPDLWHRVADRLGGPAAAAEVPTGHRPVLPPRDEDPTRTLPRHPLLAAWGRDARELQTVVATAPATVHPLPQGTDTASTLLARLQDDVRRDVAPWTPGDPERRPVLARDDRSVQVHRCHGRTRQVEVLRDVLLGVLADHPHLEPRDVVVLCPDIETFAPLVQAVFGAQGDPATAEGPDLRVQLADRALRRTNPLLRVLAEVLDLVDDRVTASAVLDLTTRAPVRARFGFDEADLERLEERLASAGIRWGLDASHREGFGVPTAANTWRAGLDRLLTGVAVDAGGLRTVGGVPPEADVEGADVVLTGRLAELLDRLAHAVRTLTGPHPLRTWLRHLEQVTDDLCAVGRDDDGQRLQVTRTLEQVAAAADAAPGTADLPLTLAEVRELLGDRLQGAPSRASHRTGDLTVCTMVPMRSVPHEVVVLLGMDDEVFPRRTVPDGDDLLAAAPRVGDRDARTEDRQLLLDALLAARSHLVVLTTGHDERTNDPQPPAVPIGELLDVIDRTARSEVTDADGRVVPASTLVTVDHPLQPFDATRFTPGGTGHPGHPVAGDTQPFGFDADALEAARAAQRPPVETPPFLPATEDLGAGDGDPASVTLGELGAFVAHPCQALLRQRLQLTFPRDGDVTDDAIPIDLPGGLARWAVGERLFAARAAGAPLPRALEVERRLGTLPPGRLADDGLADVTATLDAVLDAAEAFGVDLDAPGRAVDVDVTLPSGRRLVGTVADVVGHTRRRAGYTRLGPKHRLAAWIDVLALTVQDPTQPWGAVTLGNARDEAGTRKGSKATASVSRIGPLGEVVHRAARRHETRPCVLGAADDPPEQRRACAVEHLEVVLDLRDRGLRGALPLPCKTAHAYGYAAWLADLGISPSKTPPTKKASDRWATPDRGRFPNEDVDPANRLVLGDLTIDELLALPPADGEDGPGWFADVEDGRFGRLARRLWWPLLGSEQLEDRWPQ